MIFRSTQSRQNRKIKTQNFYSLHRIFQKRFVLLLTSAAILSSLIFSLLAFYFTFENLNLFKSIAFDTYPQFVRHIERESHWVMTSLLISIAATGFSVFKISMRMTSHLIDPLVVMEKHMRKVIQGDWQSSQFRVSESSDFRDLTLTYDYLLNTLKSMTENEIELLSRMRLDAREKETVRIWAELMNEKRRRLGLPEVSVTSLMTDVKPSQHHAS
jgi:hypothetical protein